MVPLVVQYGHFLFVGKGEDGSYLCIWVCWICAELICMCCCSGCFCCTWYTRVHCSFWLCNFLCCDRLQAEHSCIPQHPSQSVHVPESLAALELLSWPLACWCLSAIFSHLLLLGGCYSGKTGQMFSVFALLLSCDICVRCCWTSSKVLVLCCSLSSKFTVWCILLEFCPIFTLVELL